MKLADQILVAAGAVCAFSGVASAQVRTVGPIAPYLVTGRSVSVPPYGHHERKKDEDMRGATDAGANSSHGARSNAPQSE